MHSYPQIFTAVTWVPVSAVVGALFVVCLLVGLSVAGGLLYRKRIQKPRSSLEPVKFTNANEVLAIAVHPQVEDNLENCTTSEDVKVVSVSIYEVSFAFSFSLAKGKYMLILNLNYKLIIFLKNSDESPQKSTEPAQTRTMTFSERYQQDPCMRYIVQHYSNYIHTLKNTWLNINSLILFTKQGRRP